MGSALSQRDVEAAWNLLAVVADCQQHYEEALIAWTKALTLTEALSKSEPSNALFQNDMI